jgi:hypothetical protein
MMKTYLNSRKQMKNLKEKYFKKWNIDKAL